MEDPPESAHRAVEGMGSAAFEGLSPTNARSRTDGDRRQAFVCKVLNVIPPHFGFAATGTFSRKPSSRCTEAQRTVEGSQASSSRARKSIRTLSSASSQTSQAVADFLSRDDAGW